MDQTRFDLLMDGLVDNSLSEAEQQELLLFLQTEPALADELQNHLAIDSLVKQLASDDSGLYRDRISQSINSMLFTETGSPDEPGSVWIQAARLLPWGLAAALLVSTSVLALIVVQKMDPPTPLATVTNKPQQKLVTNSASDKDPTLETIVEALPPNFCRAINSSGIVKDSGDSLESSTLPPGIYHAEDHAVGLQFSSGIQLALRGPARFELIDTQNFRLFSGSARIVVPQNERGFTVHVPGGRFEDQGTEFGISVDPENHRSELLVFEGHVKILSDTGEFVDSVGERMAVRLNANGRVHQIAADPSQYVALAEIRFVNWSVHSMNLSADPDLMVYFPWREVHGSQSLVNEAIRHGVGTPDVKGTRTVSGRWNGKSAILFDQDKDYVEVNIERDLPRMTISTWVNIDRLDYSVTSIFNSNGWSPGKIHFQVTRTGQVWIGVNGEADNLRILSQPISTGRWHFLVATVDCEKHERRIYVDGKLSSHCEIPDSIAFVNPGSSRLGNWLPEKDVVVNRDRAMRGKMDEFGVWSRILSAEEISEMWASGNPYPVD